MHLQSTIKNLNVSINLIFYFIIVEKIEIFFAFCDLKLS